MIIYKEKVNSTIGSKNPPKLWLIFGTDEGEVDLIVKKIIEKAKDDSYELTTIDDNSELKNSITARSLFQPNKIVVLTGATDSSLDSIISSISQLKNSDYLIVRGGDLKKTSKLRSFFESHESGMALNCYKLDSYSILPTIEEELKNHKILFDRDVPSIIAGMVSTDSRIIKSEIEKIALFLSDSHDRKLTATMVEELISSSCEMSLDRLFSAIVLRKEKVVASEVQLIDNYMFVIRAFQNYLIRLTSVQKDLGTLGIDVAMNKLKPPLFGRYRTEFIEVVRKSLLEENLSLLEEVIQLECDIKQLSVDQTQLLIQSIYEMVLASR